MPELSYDPAIALLGIYPKYTDVVKRRDICTPNVHSNNGHSHQIAERTKMPFNRWMDKVDMVHIYSGILCLYRKGWMPNFCITMDGTGDYAEWNKSSRESRLSYGFTFLWSIRNNTRGHREMERRKALREIGGGDKPWETVDSEKQTEGLGGEKEEG